MKINAVLPEKGRDLRLDLFRGIANWAIFLDHIPDNVVNWVTTRNYGFSDAADLFVFISAYTACFVYARMMIERGFIVGATRLTKRVWQLYVAHVILFVIYIVAISYLARRFMDSDLINEFNVAGPLAHAHTNPGPGAPAQVQAGQPGRVAALHCADGRLSAHPLVHAAPTRCHHDCLDRALAAGPPFRLEYERLSCRFLVFRPLLLAGCVGVRLMGRARRRQACGLDHQFQAGALFRRRLSDLCNDHDDGGPLLRLWRAVSELALFGLQSERQDLHGTLPLPAFHRDCDAGGALHSEELAGAGVEGL